ncbi:hypothetical protein [Flavobacterium mesophilum]|uniref:hypothetical protein n=1 Tax=Flavobacterium mesophilum TaxID=3143495 RepID=UPI0031D42FEB
MKIKLIALIIVCSLNACRSQNGKNNTNNSNETMKNFDINKYKGIKLDSEIDTSFNDKNKNIRITSDKKNIQVEEVEKDNPFKTTIVYFKNNKKINSSIKRFYTIPTGISKEYDENGNLKKETDWDKNYGFTLDNLIQKMNTEYKIDITNVDKTFDINRFIVNQVPYYEVYSKDIENSQKLHCFIIDGKKGKTLFTTIRYINDKNGSLYDQYINSIKKK